MSERYRLKAIIMSANFSFSPERLYDELRRNKALWQGEVRQGECYLFVSCDARKLYWILGRWQLSDGAVVYDTRRWSMAGGQTFSHLMLGEYARQCEIKLSNFGSYKDEFEAWKQRRRERAAELRKARGERDE